jgi:hypothetical protein
MDGNPIDGAARQGEGAARKTTEKPRNGAGGREDALRGQ